MLDRIASTISEYGLMAHGGSVVVGVSGGADSIALLYMLLRLAPQHGWRVCAAHFNHGIRGVGAEEDELFVREFCEAHGVPLACETGDVSAYARANGMSIESAGRTLRYEFLERERVRFGCDVIAVAHHMDDNAESILLHLLRGSGLLGLTGIQPRRGNIIRPLINVRRSEIESYLDEEGIAFCTDETNLIPEGTRNRLRLDIIPYIEEYINPAIVSTLCSTAQLLLKDEAHLNAEAGVALEAARRSGGFDRAYLDGIDQPIKTRAIRMALAEAGAVTDIERVHVEAVCELLHGRTGARMTLPNVEAWTSYELIKFGKPEKHEPFETELVIDGITHTPLGDFRTELTEGSKGFYKSRSTAFLDYDRLTQPLVVRTRRDGDRFHPVNAPGRRKLKEYFIDRKVDRTERYCIPLIAMGEEVLFVTGFSSSETAKITDGTEHMLKIEYIG